MLGVLKVIGLFLLVWQVLSCLAGLMLGAFIKAGKGFTTEDTEEEPCSTNNR